MKVRLSSSQRRIPVRPRRIERNSRRLLLLSGLDRAELGVVLAGASRMRRLNREFRGRDRPTDVLSFPQVEPGEIGRIKRKKESRPFLLGDIVICPEVALRNARLYGATLDEEISRLLVHGFVHLLGYDHELGEEEERKMTRKEREFLRAL